MKLKYKIFIVCFLFLVLYLLFFSEDVNAFSFTFENNTYNLELPFSETEHPDFLILKFTNGSGYQVLYPQSDYDLPFYRTKGDGIQYFIKDTSSYGQWNYYNYNFSTNSWTGLKTTSQREAKIYSNHEHVADLVYSKYDVILSTDNSIWYRGTDGSAYFKPKLEAIEFVQTLDGYFLRTNILDYDLYCDVDGIGSGYDLHLYNSDTKKFELCEYITKFSTYTRSDGVNTVGIQLYYPVSRLGVYHFMLVNKQNPSIKSNASTFNLNDFSGAKILWYDVSAPIYDYAFENNKAVVYTNYLDVKYYNVCNLNYIENVDGEVFYHAFNKNIISKEYNIDKTKFRFKLVFDSACAYHCCYVLDGDAGFYISEISTFNIVQEYFDTNGYQEEKSSFGRFGDFLKNFFLGLFVPSDNYLQSRIDSLGEKLNTKIPYKQYIEDFEQLSEIEHESRDITVSADLSNYKVSDDLYIDKPKFLDFSFMSKYQNVWFSWVRVVVYIGLIIFNLNMLTKYLRGFNLADGSFRLVNNNKN